MAQDREDQVTTSCRSRGLFFIGVVFVYALLCFAEPQGSGTPYKVVLDLSVESQLRTETGLSRRALLVLLAEGRSDPDCGYFNNTDG